jgi:hypothetical protein
LISFGRICRLICTSSIRDLASVHNDGSDKAHVRRLSDKLWAKICSLGIRALQLDSDEADFRLVTSSPPRFRLALLNDKDELKKFIFNFFCRISFLIGVLKHKMKAPPLVKQRLAISK